MSLDKFKLDGKTAIVTGGAGGIGSCIARALADAGADICVADLGQDRIDAAIASVEALGKKAHGIETDVLKQEVAINSAVSTATLILELRAYITTL